MKYVLMALMGIGILVGCKPVVNETHMHIDSRDSLDIYFPNHPDLKEALSDDELFLLYARSVHYSLTNIKDNDIVEWVGPDEYIDGRLTLLSSTVLDGKECRKFAHQLRIDKVQYFGEGEACKDVDHDTWNVKIPRK